MLLSLIHSLAQGDGCPLDVDRLATEEDGAPGRPPRAEPGGSNGGGGLQERDREMIEAVGDARERSGRPIIALRCCLESGGLE